MAIRFEWDEEKAAVNKRKHGVSFNEAQTVFTDDFSIVKADIEHSDNEERWLIIGASNKNRVIIVSFTEREDVIRLISARKAIRNERKQYENDDI